MWTAVAALITLVAGALIPAMRGDFLLPRASRVKTLLDLRASEGLPADAAERLDRLIVIEVRELEMREQSRSNDVVRGRPFVDRLQVLYPRWMWAVFAVLMALIEVTGAAGEATPDVGAGSRFASYWFATLTLALVGRWLARRGAYALLKEDADKVRREAVLDMIESQEVEVAVQVARP